MEVPQWAIQDVLSLGSSDPHFPFKLWVSAASPFTSWNYGVRTSPGPAAPLKLSDPYTPFERQQLTCRYIFMDTECMIHGPEIVL